MTIPRDVHVFTQEWEESDPSPTPPRRPWRCVLVFLDDPERQRRVRDLLETARPGASVVTVARGTALRRLAADRYEIGAEPGEGPAAEYDTLIRHVLADHQRVDAVAHLWSAEDPDLLWAPDAVVSLMGALVRSEATPDRVVLGASYTDGAQRCAAESWLGFERSAGLLMTDTVLTTLVLDASPGSDAGRAMIPESAVAELGSVEPAGALRTGGRRLVRRVRVAELGTAGSEPIRAGGTYLITGGLGGLGTIFADWLARSYRARLVLLGRRDEDETVRLRLRDLREAGAAETLYRQADVTDLPALTRVVDDSAARTGGIDGVLHTAGLHEDGTIAERSSATFARVLAPKVAGTLNLDRALRGHNPDFICYFSSTAAVLGDFGGCDYACANEFQAAHARLLTLQEPAGPRRLAINWPLWNSSGMNFADATASEFYLRSTGQRLLEPEEGTRLFREFLSRPGGQFIALAGRAERIHTMLGADRPSSAALSVPDPSPAAETTQEAASGHLAVELREIVAQILRIPAERIVADERFRDFGFDSVSLVEFAGVLSERLGVDFTPDLFFNHTTLQELESFLVEHSHRRVRERYGTDDTAPEASARPPSEEPRVGTRRVGDLRTRRSRGDRFAAGRRSRPAAANERGAAERDHDAPIALVGMSGRFPGARDVDELWNLLLEGTSAVGPVPAERDPSWADGKARRIGWLPGVAEFDPRFFEIAPSEAEYMDPRQRLLLEEMWKALEGAAYGPERLAAERVGVFVGVEEGDYRPLAAEGESVTSNHNAVLASRLSYFLNLTGPAVAVNTACSSGLVAVHEACLSLRNGDCDTALVAAANIMATPREYDALDKAGMLSPEGVCRAFDTRADGMVPGEAVATVVLTRRDLAEERGLEIHATLLGSGVNNDGRTNGITAPSGHAQTRLLDDVYRRAGVSPQAVDYVIGHGTGTRLGDPVEVKALTEAFLPHVGEAGSCALTSVKPNLGHTLAPSGLVSLIAMVLAMRNETIPPSIECERTSDFVAWQDSPVYVNRQTRSWPERPGAPRVGGVSAFGFSGTNAHVVVESGATPRAWLERVGEQPTRPYHLLLCSAKTDSALERVLGELADHLEAWSEAGPGVLASVSATLISGRHHGGRRCALVVRDLGDAVAALRSAATGEEHSDSILRGTVPRDFSAQSDEVRSVRELVASGREATPSGLHQTLIALGRSYCHGHDPARFSGLWAGDDPSPVALPAYPFDQAEYWAQRHEAPARGGADGQSTAPHGPSTDARAQGAGPARIPGAGRKPHMGDWTLDECMDWELADAAGEVLGIPAGELDTRENLANFGFDSLNITKFATELSGRFGFAVTPDVFFSHPTLRRLRDHLLGTHGEWAQRHYRADERVSTESASPMSEPGPRPPGPSNVAAGAGRAEGDRPAAPGDDADQPVIVGMSGRFPGARDLDELWALLSSGHSAIRDVPAERLPWWSGGDVLDGRAPRIGAIPGHDEFDPVFFEIAPRDAELMDPRQRLLLEEMWKALEDAGYGAERVARERVGVFVGVEEGDYRYLVDGEAGIAANSNAVLAARLGYFLDLTGPSLSINTACSSGLVALHEACLSLRHGDCDTAIVAAASVMASAHDYVAMDKATMLSPDLTCYAFDQRANGMVPGEAVAVLVLKRREAAERDGNPFHATVLGSGVNYDGRTNGITAPSGEAQANLLRSLYARHGIAPDTIDHLVAHGTGTRLGDPIEVNALVDAFRTSSERTGFCALTSVKPNLGHSMAASGLVNVIALALAMRHEAIPPSINCDELSDYVDWDNSPFFVNRQARPWPASADRPRRGATSSFGMSGTNAHVVLQAEHVSQRGLDHPTGNPVLSHHLLLVSAKTEEALTRRIEELAAYLDGNGDDAQSPLASVSHTLMVGRYHFAHRCAVVARDRDEAVRLLREVAAGVRRPRSRRALVPRDFAPNDTIARAVQELVRAGRALRDDAATYQDHLSALAEFYCQGYEPAFSGLWDSPPPLSAGLPAYPFAAERYWAAPATERRSLPSDRPSAPEVSVQRFSTRFTGGEGLFNGPAVAIDPASTVTARSAGGN